MTPKEEAKQIVNKFIPTTHVYRRDDNHNYQVAKKCALIHVEGLIEEYDNKILTGRPSHLEACKYHWNEVKKEIQKL